MKRSTVRRTKLIGRLIAFAGVVVFAVGVTGVPSAAAPGHSNSGNSQNGNGNGNGGGNPDNDDNGGPGGNAGNDSGNNGCGVGNGGGNGSNGGGGGTGENCPGGGSGGGTDPGSGGGTDPGSGGGTDPGSGGEGTESDTSGDSGGSGSPGSGVTAPGPAGSDSQLGSGTADPEVLGEVVGSPGSVNPGGVDPAGTAQAPEELAFTGPAMALPMAFSGLGMMAGGAFLTARTRRRPSSPAWTSDHSPTQPVGFRTQGDARLFGGHLRGEADLASPVCGWRARPLSLPSDGLGEARTGEA